MNFRFLAVGLLLFFVSFPVCLLVYEQRNMRQFDLDLTIKNTRETAGRKLEAVQKSANWELQLKSIFGSFKSELGLRVAEKASSEEVISRAETLYQEKAATWLPPHDFVLADVTTGSPRIILRKSGVALFPEDGLLTEFVAWASGDDRNDKALSRRISQALGFPMVLNPAQRILGKGKLKGFQGNVKQGALLWDVLPLKNGHTLFLGFLMDVRSLDPFFGQKTLAKSWNDPDCGLAFLPVKPELPCIASDFVKVREGLEARLVDILAGRKQPGKSPLLDGILPCFGNFAPDSPYQVVLLYPITLSGSGKITEVGLILAGGLLIFGSFLFFVRRIFYGQGPHISISVSLLGTFVLVALMPMAGAFGLGKRFIAENERRERGKIATGLSRDLARLDDRARVFHGNLVRRIKNLCESPEMTALFRDEEVRFLQVAAQASAADEFATAASSPVAAKFVEELSKQLHTEEKPTGCSVVGPGAFFSDWTIVSSNPEDAQSTQMMNQVMKLICQDHLVRANPSLAAPGSGESAGSGGKLSQEDVKAGMMKDEFVKMLKGVAGPDTFLNMFKYPRRVNEIGMSAGRMFFTFLPVKNDGMVRYLCNPNWTDKILDRPAMEEALATESSRALFPGIFAVSRKLPNSSETKSLESIPEGISSHPSLSGLVDAVGESKIPLRGYDEASGMILEAIPPRHVSLYILAGQRSAAHLKTESRSQWNWFLALLVAILLLAVGVSFSLAEYFLGPLKKVLDAIAQINQGNYTHHLDASRSDEFGSLARAYNAMTEKLQEGKFLKRYVSSFVLEALSDEKYRAIAQQGEQAEVTVLFSTLVGFEAFEMQSSPEEIFRVLEIHLGAANRAVDAFGGVIDKVMGETILIIFPHRQFETPQKAAQAAVQVMRKIKAELRGASPLSPAMGMNSGMAIVGILGAGNIRRKDFTAIGDTVNLAARLSSIALTTTGSQVVLSGRVLELLGASAKTQKLPLKMVKGKTQEVEAHLWIEDSDPSAPGS